MGAGSMSVSRMERKRDLQSRTLKVTNGDRPLRTCILRPGLTLEESVKEIVENYARMETGNLEGRDLSIWRNGRLIAVSHYRNNRNVITLFGE
jgi:hypothetical protein